MNRKLSAQDSRNKSLAEELSSSTMKKGKKVLVAETIKEEEDSQDTLDREINEYYDYEADREATQD
nr:hypothetical protein [Tanacetum cinerariifolium]